MVKMVKIEYFKNPGYLISKRGERTPEGIEISDANLANCKFMYVLEDARDIARGIEEDTGEPVEIVVTLPAHPRRPP